MRALIINGAAGEIGSKIASGCIEKGLFGRYILLCRDAGRLPGGLADAEGVSVVGYEMSGVYGDESVIASESLEGCDELDLVLSAFTIEPIRKAWEIGSGELEANLKVNVLGQVRLINNCVRIAEEKGMKLRIVFIDSGAAYHPLKGWSLYCASKAYMDMYLRCVKEESGADVVLYDPGVVDTGMQATIRESSEDDFDRVEEFRGYKERGILNSPMDVAENIIERYLVSWTATEITEEY